MSYVRWGQIERDGFSGMEGGSHVYIYGTVDGRIECCACGLRPDAFGLPPFTVADEAELLTHLYEHRAAGHNVPQWLIDDLTAPTPPAPSP